MTRVLCSVVLALVAAALAGCVVAPAPAPYAYGYDYGYYAPGPAYVYSPPVSVGIGFGERVAVRLEATPERGWVRTPSQIPRRPAMMAELEVSCPSSGRPG